MTYLFTEEAAEDLVNIQEYTLVHWGHSQAEKYFSELERTVELIAANLGIGIKRNDIKLNSLFDIFSFPVMNHMIY